MFNVILISCEYFESKINHLFVYCLCIGHRGCLIVIYTVLLVFKIWYLKNIMISYDECLLSVDTYQGLSGLAVIIIGFRSEDPEFESPQGSILK